MSEQGESSTTIPAEPSAPRTAEGAQYRATDRVQFKRQDGAARGTMLVESSFNNTDGGTVATYTGTGRAMQMQEWTFGPNGRLVGITVKDALITGNIPSTQTNGRRAKELLASTDREVPEWMSLARTIALRRDPSGNTFSVVEGSEVFNGNIMREWNAEREAHARDLTARRPKATTTG